MGSFPSLEPRAAASDDQPTPSLQSSVLSDGRETHNGNASDAPPLARARPRHAPAKKPLPRGRIVFLGLDGAGKTTLVRQLLQSGVGQEAENPAADDATAAPPDENRRRHGAGAPHPTKATGVAAYRLDGDRHVLLVDPPGRRALRAAHWRAALASSEFPPGLSNGPGSSSGTGPVSLPVVGVVFVVDATDLPRFPLVARELVAFQRLRDARSSAGGHTPAPAPTSLATQLQRAPFVVVLNKLDAGAPINDDNDPTTSASERRRASRATRHELQAAFDHQLRVDQKRHPRAYREDTNSHAAHASSFAIAASQARAAQREANRLRSTLLMAALVECGARDADAVRAFHALLRDEIARLWAGGS